MRGDFKEGLFELGLPLKCGGFGLVGRTQRKGLRIDQPRQLKKKTKKSVKKNVKETGINRH